MSALNVKIDKFARRNRFSLRQIKMRALLKQQGFWAPLSKDKNIVTTPETANLEEKAHSTIMLCLSDEIITEVSDEKTAAGLWLKLESLYMTKSLTNKLLLKQCLLGLRMAEGTSLREHLEKLNTLLLKLRNIDVKIEDEDVAMILLVSLPISFGKDTISLEKVRSTLHRRELRHMANGTSIDVQPSDLFISSGKGMKYNTQNYLIRSLGS